MGTLFSGATATTTLADFYTPSTGMDGHIQTLIACNKGGAFATFTLVLNDGTRDFHISNGVTIGNGASVEIKGLHVKNGFKLKIMSGTNAVIDVTAYGAELPVGTGDV